MLQMLYRQATVVKERVACDPQVPPEVAWACELCLQFAAFRTPRGVGELTRS
jgi:hypothetical protein